jgi:hypothetical protein
VVLVLNKGSVGKDLADADLPELVHEDLQVVDEPSPPGDVPVGVAGAGTDDEQRTAELVEGELVVDRR